MQFQSWLNVSGLATTAIAACLMFLSAPLVTTNADAAERVVGSREATSRTERTVAARRRSRSRVAVAVLFVGFLLQLIAALLPRQPAEAPSVDDAAATTAVPAGCESAASAEECADILARVGKNPYAAYGVVGRAPTYARRRSVAATPRRIEPAASAGADSESPTQREPPATTALLVPSGVIAYPLGNTQFEEFGLDVAYGLVGVLRKESRPGWKLFEYRIGIYDDTVRATYGADSIDQPIGPQAVARSTSFICAAAAKRPTLQFVKWSVALRFVQWDSGQLASEPFSVRPSDCR